MRQRKLGEDGITSLGELEDLEAFIPTEKAVFKLIKGKRSLKGLSKKEKKALKVFVGFVREIIGPAGKGFSDRKILKLLIPLNDERKLARRKLNPVHVRLLEEKAAEMDDPEHSEHLLALAPHMNDEHYRHLQKLNTKCISGITSLLINVVGIILCFVGFKANLVEKIGKKAIKSTGLVLKVSKAIAKSADVVQSRKDLPRFFASMFTEIFKYIDAGDIGKAASSVMSAFDWILLGVMLIAKVVAIVLTKGAAIVAKVFSAIACVATAASLLIGIAKVAKECPK